MVLAIAVVAGLAAAGYVGYVYGKKIEAKTTALYKAAHSLVSAKFAAVMAEVAKIEAEAKAEEQAVVARLKKLL